MVLSDLKDREVLDLENQVVLADPEDQGILVDLEAQELPVDLEDLVYLEDREVESNPEQSQKSANLVRTEAWVDL